MWKRCWCVVAAILLSAGAARAQGQDGPVLPPANDVGPVMPPPTEEVVEFTPMAQLARTLASSDARLWANADYLFAFMRGSQPIPLATTAASGTPRSQAGILGQPTTAVLFGSDRFGDNLRAGFRVAAGLWFNPEQTLGIEGGFLMTSSQAGIFSAASGNGTILARPYIDATTGLPQAVLVAFPGLSNGSIDIRANTGNVYSFNLDLSEKAFDTGSFRVYSLFGYKFYRYDESLRVQQTIAPLAGGAFVPGTLITSNDNFSTRNEFHGLDLGFRSELALSDRLKLEVLTKVAVGRLHRDVDIGGNQTSLVPGAAPVTQIGGVLALSSNQTSFAESDWRAIPEVGVNFAWQIRPSTMLRVGWSFIYFAQFARAADQIDPNINPHLLPGANAALGGPNSPAFNLQRSDLWLQSFNLGLEFVY
ncbi:MAG TPA: BBP7 family outer membrane beta-barrel protein [Gemmataceae bacterium]|nr:BBP7 family outer membrane beta-barrel protein [Gemmataceae bacterium]